MTMPNAGPSTAQHSAEIGSGARFEFGRNWRRFLSALDDERIALAEKSLCDFLELHRLDGLSFLDIGSGSGLFSLAARRLGAAVVSFDYDPQSVACTAELRSRYRPGDTGWTILQGSVLDRDFLGRLGRFDIVYSWGVLHHTGAMREAFDNIKPLVPVGGRLYIAIYNDLGAVTDRWSRVKRRYNRLPAPLKLPFALSIIALAEARVLYGHLRRGDPGGYLRSWTEYKTTSRGMSHWHDWIDWIGGFPYERAAIEDVVDAFAADGFALTKLEDRSSGYGCNEYVFRREAPAGTAIDRPLAGSRLFARRFGRRLADARRGPSGDGEWLLLRGSELLARIEPGGFHIPAEVTGRPGFDPMQCRIVDARTEAVASPFQRRRGHMWAIAAPHLARLADNAGPPEMPRRSPVFLFEDGRQLVYPHSIHHHIARVGRGRFSHWGDRIYFSTSDNSNPNTNGRSYLLVYPAEPVGSA
jgi:SAM-dependent methyltransferase